MARSAAARPRGRSSRLPRGRQGLFMRVAVGVLGMLVAVLTVFVSRRRVLLGLLMLAMGVVVGRLQVMVRGRVMVCGGLHVILDGRVLALLGHGWVLLQEFKEPRRNTHDFDRRQPLVGADRVSNSVG